MPRVALDGMQLQVGHGAARTLGSLIRGLARPAVGFEPIVITSEAGRQFMAENAITSVETLVVPHMPNSVWEQFGLPWYARKVKADALYTLRALSPLWAPPTLLHFTDEPTDCALSGATATSPRERLVRFYQRTALKPGLRRARIIAAFTQPIADRLVELYGPVLRNLRVVPLGVDASLFKPSETPEESFIFHLGSWEPRDETVSVVKAYGLAKADYPALPPLKVAGNLGALSDAAKEAAMSAGVERDVEFLGRVSDSDLSFCYANAMVCLQPSRYEGFGLTPLEAIACGAPLVVNEEPAIRAVMGDAAFMTPDATAGSLSKAITALSTDAALRQHLRQVGLARSREFTWEATTDAIRAGLMEILAR